MSKFGGVSVDGASRYGGKAVDDGIPDASDIPKTQPDEQTLADGFGRAAGLTARSALEGFTWPATATADLLTYPFQLLSRGIQGHDLFPSYQETFSKGLTELGLPQPETGTERLTSEVGKGVTSVAGSLALAKLLGGARGPTTRGIGDILSTAPGVQVASSIGGHGGGEIARQSGASPVGQTMASLAGSFAPIPAAVPFMKPQMKSLPTGAATSATEAQSLRATQQTVDNTVDQGFKAIGLDPMAIEPALMDKMRINVRKAMSMGDDLPPEALARKVLYESVGISPTRALITRSFKDAFNEQNLLASPEGQAIRDIYIANNTAMRQRIKGLSGEQEPTTDPQFGQQFRQRLSEGERKSQALANKKFRAAMEAEGDAPASVQPLVDYIQDNASILEATATGKPLMAIIRKMGIVSDGNMQSLPATAQSPQGRMGYRAAQITLKDLSDLRVSVNNAWKSAQKSGDAQAEAQLNQMRQLINQAEEQAGGDMFKAYRELRTAKGQRYENNPLINDLLKDKKGFSGTDFIEDSDVFNKAVLNSTPEQFSKVWPRLLPKARDLTRSQVAAYIDDRVFSNMAMNERGDVVASAAKLNQALRKLGPEKIEMIFGKETAKDITRLSQVVREISNPPQGTRPQGSAPALNYLVRNILGAIGVTKIPLGGPAVEGVLNFVERGAQSAANRRDVGAAISLLDPAVSGTTVDKIIMGGKASVAPQLGLLGDS